MYHERSKETGHFIDFMIDKQLFDLEAKKEKKVAGIVQSLMILNHHSSLQTLMVHKAILKL